MFLPTTIKEVRARGWEQLDVILFSGDAYIDHPAFGAAVIGHKAGERVYVRVNDDYGYYAEIRSIEKGQDDASLEISAY